MRDQVIFDEDYCDRVLDCVCSNSSIRESQTSDFLRVDK